MHAEIIATGSELLLGEVVDTNSTFIARKLRDVGLNLFFKTVVGDNEERMAEALRIALNRSDVIITTGGLGPTVDDVTRPAVARSIGRALIFRPDLMEQIEARFQAYGSKMGENNQRQAYVPDGATPIENPVGTAPAFICEQNGKIIISLPGVPREMEYLIEHSVLPYLKVKLGLNELIIIRTLHAVGLGESRIDAAIGDLETALNPTVGLSAKSGQVDVRITAKAATRATALRMLDDMEQQVRARIGDSLFGLDDDTLEGVIAGLLAEQKFSLASVELGTGGLIGGRLSSMPGDQFFRGGLVLSDIKSLYRAIEGRSSSDSALASVLDAARGIRQVHNSELGLAAMLRDVPEVKGLKLFVALAAPNGEETLERGFGGHSGLAAQWASTLALGLVWQYLVKQVGD
jgi:nicotinamide-nucleotide amidase